MSKNLTLLYSIEQWELIRRLRNSGLSKEQIGQAFDDLDRIEQELGTIYNLPANNSNNGSPFQNQINTTLSNLNGGNEASSVFANNMQIFQMAKNLASLNGQRSNPTSNLNFNQNPNAFIKHELVHKNELIGDHSASTFSNGGQSSMATTVVNNHFATIIDPDQESKLVEEFRA